jgi:hypothetical protein
MDNLTENDTDVKQVTFCSGYGQFHTANPEKKNPKPYVPHSLGAIKAGLETPESVPKDRARWAIFSTLWDDTLSRNHELQRKQGEFVAAWADVDKLTGQKFFNVVDKAHGILDADFFAYTSSSATKENPKCRIVVPYDSPIPGRDHVLIQKILNDKLEAAGIVPDRATERAGQVCYLPNNPNGFYEHFENEIRGPFTPLTAWADELKVVKDAEKEKHKASLKHQAESYKKAQERIVSSQRDVMVAYKESFPILCSLDKYSYRKSGDKWTSPNSESGNPGVSISPDGQKWFSHHSSDSGIGQHNGDGTFGDAWDLFKFWEHGNNDAAAFQAAGDMFLTESGETFNKANQKEFMQKKGEEETNRMFDNTDGDEQQFADFPPLMPSETAVNITEAPAPPDALITYRDNPLLTRGIVGGVTAQGGTGKTFFLQQLAYALADGTGFGPLKAADSEGFQVLMLCGEDPPDEVDRRLWAISGESTYFPDNLHIASTVGRLGPLMRLEKNNPVKAPAFYWLRETIKNHEGLALLIIDPKSRYYGLDENNNDHGTQWISALESLAQEFNITILFTHHVSKANGQTLDQNMSRGASAIVDGCRWVAGMSYLSKDECNRYEINNPQGYVVFNITKTNYAAGLQSKLVFKRTENGVLKYAALEAGRRNKLTETIYAAIKEAPGEYSRRDLERGNNGAGAVLVTINLNFPNFKKKEFPSLLNEMVQGRLLEEKEVPAEGKGRPKTCLFAVELDPMDFGQKQV